MAQIYEQLANSYASRDSEKDGSAQDSTTSPSETTTTTTATTTAAASVSLSEAEWEDQALLQCCETPYSTVMADVDSSVLAAVLGDTIREAEEIERADKRQKFDTTELNIVSATEAIDSQEGDSLFSLKESAKTFMEKGVKMVADPTPLPQSRIMNCAGTLTVYVNEKNQVDEFQFLYTAMDTIDT